MTIRQSATVLALGEYRTRHRPIYFTRAELNLLLGLYSRHVARGVWRDYAIDHRDGMALFSVFRRSHESAAYSIAKTAPVPGRPVAFVVLSGRQRLRTAPSLIDALEFFRKRLTLVAEPG
jgi:hypothetical protein